MEFETYFPVWNQLTPEQQALISSTVTFRKIPKGTIVHNGSMDCSGLMLLRSGQLRSYIMSEEGREITLYRLFDMDLCLFTASCMMRGIQFDITIEAEKDTEVWVIPPEVFKKVADESAPMANYMNEIMASHFSEVMWLVEQIMWKSFDKRLAGFLLDETALEGTNKLKITHEIIGNHLGTAREVVTRMLRYFQSEGFVKLTRGAVEVVDPVKLKQLSEG